MFISAAASRGPAPRPRASRASPAQFVLLISHSIQNVMQCKEFFYCTSAYALCQYAVTKKKQNDPLKLFRRDQPVQGNICAPVSDSQGKGAALELFRAGDLVQLEDRVAVPVADGASQLGEGDALAVFRG